MHEQFGKVLLEGPISPDRLFWPLIQEAVIYLQQASEEAVRVEETAVSPLLPLPTATTTRVSC